MFIISMAVVTRTRTTSGHVHRKADILEVEAVFFTRNQLGNSRAGLGSGSRESKSTSSDSV